MVGLGRELPRQPGSASAGKLGLTGLVSQGCMQGGGDGRGFGHPRNGCPADPQPRQPSTARLSGTVEWPTFSPPSRRGIMPLQEFSLEMDEIECTCANLIYRK